MKKLHLVSTLFAATFTLAACDRPTVVNVPPSPAPSTSTSTTTTVPVPVPGPAGPPGEPGKPGSGTTVIVTPPASAASN